MEEVRAGFRRRNSSAELTRWQLAELIIDIGGILLTALDDLQAAVSNLQAQVGTENDELASVVASLKAVQQQLADLQAQITAGGNVTADQLEAIASTVTDVANSATAAVQSARGPAPSA